MELQTTQATIYDRYPHVFTGTKLIIQKEFSDLIRNLEVLSFGCSTGEEIKTLYDKYISNANFTGVDIHEPSLNKAKELLKDYENTRFINFNEFSSEFKRYDIIFCLSILCKHLFSKNEPPISFKLFDKTLVLLDEALNIGGYLVVYNSNYCILDSSIGNKYEPIYVETITESNLNVQMYCKDGINLREFGICLFKKIK